MLNVIYLVPLILLILVVLFWFSFFVLLPLAINYSAKKNARRNAERYLSALKAKDFVAASSLMSKLVLRDNNERQVWIKKMEKCAKNWSLVSFDIISSDFANLSGRYTRTVYVGVSRVDGTDGEMHMSRNTMRLVEDNRTEGVRSLRIVSSPETVDEERERVKDDFFLINPVPKASSG